LNATLIIPIVGRKGGSKMLLTYSGGEANRRGIVGKKGGVAMKGERCGMSEMVGEKRITE